MILTTQRLTIKHGTMLLAYHRDSYMDPRLVKQRLTFKWSIPISMIKVVEMCFKTRRALYR